VANEVNANIQIGIDSSQALASLKTLQNQISSFNKSVIASNAAAVAAQKSAVSGLASQIGATKQFSTSIVNVESSVSRLGKSIDRNKLTLGEYFKYGVASSKNFGSVFKKEHIEMTALAESRVKRLQTQYIALGAAQNGVTKAMAVRPLNLYNADLAIATQRQQLFSKLLSDGSTSLINFGKNTQWAGRQLMVGFTVPLTIFGGMAGKVFMDLEKQIVNFRRVYGDATTPLEETNGMIDQVKELSKEFTKYGIAVKDTIGLASDAAAAGAAGEDLLAQTSAATRLSTLGMIDQQQALTATIALQSAFKLSSEELANSVNFLNAVENQTVLSLDDVTVAIPKVATVIQGLGGNVEDLSIFLAAMREGGVNAAEGANALKSGLASLINPTKAARDQLEAVGINIDAIISSNKGDIRATVMEFGNALGTLDKFSRQQTLAKVFGKYQFARLGALFENINRDGSQAQRVIDLTGESIEGLAQLADKELGAIEESIGVKFTGSIERLKLAIAPIGEVFLKVATPFIDLATKILGKFDELSPGVKQFMAVMLAGVGVVVPTVIMLIGLFGNFIGQAIKGFSVFNNFFNRLRGGGKDLQHLSDEQLDAAAAASSLEGKTSSLTNELNVQRAAVVQLARSYRNYVRAAGAAAAGLPQGFRGAPTKMMAAGGMVGGVGNKDTEPALLTPGEFVMNRKATEKFGPILDAMNRGSITQLNEGDRLSERIASTSFGDFTTQRKDSVSGVVGLLSQLVNISEADTRIVSDGLRQLEESNRLNKTTVDRLIKDLSLLPERLPDAMAKSHVFEQSQVSVSEAEVRRMVRQSGSEITSPSFLRTLQASEELSAAGAGGAIKFLPRSDLVADLPRQINDGLRRGIESTDFANAFEEGGVSKWSKAVKLSGVNATEAAPQFDLFDRKVLEIASSTNKLIADFDDAENNIISFGTIARQAIDELDNEIPLVKETFDTLESRFRTFQVGLNQDMIPTLERLGFTVERTVTQMGDDMFRLSGGTLTEPIELRARSARMDARGSYRGIKEAEDLSRLLGSSSVDSINEGTGAASESKKAQKAADNVVEGFSNQIKRGIPEAQSAAMGLGNSAMQALEESTTRTRRSASRPQGPSGLTAQQLESEQRRMLREERRARGPAFREGTLSPISFRPGEESSRIQNIDNARSMAMQEEVNRSHALAIVENEKLTKQTSQVSKEMSKTKGYVKKFGGSLLNGSMKMQGAMFALDGVIFGASMMDNSLGQLAQKILPAVFAFQGITMALPLLANPIGLAALAIGAVGVGFWLLDKNRKDLQEKIIKTSVAMNGSSKAFDDLSKELGSMKPSARFSAMFSGMSGTEKEQEALTEGQSFLETESGQAMLERAKSLAGKDRKNAIETELLQSLALEIITPDQARGVARAMSMALKDPILGASLVSSIYSYVNDNKGQVVKPIQELVTSIQNEVGASLAPYDEFIKKEKEYQDLLEKRNKVRQRGKDGKRVTQEEFEATTFTEEDRIRLEELEKEVLSGAPAMVTATIGPLIDSSKKLAEAQAYLNIQYREGNIDREKYLELTNQIQVSQQLLAETLRRMQLSTTDVNFSENLKMAALAAGMTEEEFGKMETQARALEGILVSTFGKDATWAKEASNTLQLAMTTGALDAATAGTIPDLLANDQYAVVLNLALEGDDPSTLADTVKLLNQVDMLPQPMKQQILAEYSSKDFASPAEFNTWAQETITMASYFAANPKLQVEAFVAIRDGEATTEGIKNVESFMDKIMNNSKISSEIDFNLVNLDLLTRANRQWDSLGKKKNISKIIRLDDKFSGIAKSFGATLSELDALPNVFKQAILLQMNVVADMNIKLGGFQSILEDPNASPRAKSAARRGIKSLYQYGSKSSKSTLKIVFQTGQESENNITEDKDTGSTGGSATKSWLQQLIDDTKANLALFPKMLNQLKGMGIPQQIIEMIGGGEEGVKKAQELLGASKVKA